MTMAAGVVRGPLALAIREALEMVASPPVQASILARALGEAGLESIPEAGGDVIHFVEGPLRRAIGERLGDETASEILEQLTPVLARATPRRVSMSPRATPVSSPRPTRPPTPESGNAWPAVPQASGTVAVKDAPWHGGKRPVSAPAWSTEPIAADEATEEDHSRPTVRPHGISERPVLSLRKGSGTPPRDVLRDSLRAYMEGRPPVSEPPEEIEPIDVQLEFDDVPTSTLPPPALVVPPPPPPAVFMPSPPAAPPPMTAAPPVAVPPPRRVVSAPKLELELGEFESDLVESGVYEKDIGEGPLLLVATRDERTVRDIRTLLEGRHRLVVISGLLELVDAIEGVGRTGNLSVVIDCRYPSVHVASVVALAADLPRATDVVLWGAGALERQALSGAATETASWRHLATEASAVAVVRAIQR